MLGPFDATCPACGWDPQEEDELLQPGEVLAGRYEIISKVGAGGMGMVYKAKQQPLGNEVCIKTLHQTITSDDPAFEARFEREAKVLAGLRHPNIVSILDFGSDPRAASFFVMELVDGDDLRTILKRDGPMSAERAVRIVGQVCDSLTEAHAKGIIHRDLKPSNIMVCDLPGQSDFVKVLDFGSALVLTDEQRERLTRAGMVIGTPIYMAPEYILGRNIDGRVDVYATGVMLYYLLCGSPPFKGVAQVLFAQHVGERPPRPTERNPKADASPAMERVVMKALEKDPSMRWESAAALKAAMNAALRGGSEAFVSRVAIAAEQQSEVSIAVEPATEVDIEVDDDDGPEWSEDAFAQTAIASGRHVAVMVIQGQQGLPRAVTERLAYLGRSRQALVEDSGDALRLALVLDEALEGAVVEGARFAMVAAREAKTPVRIGLHVGEWSAEALPETFSADGVAPVAERAASLAATATMGQLLVAEAHAGFLAETSQLQPAPTGSGQPGSEHDSLVPEHTRQLRWRLPLVGRAQEQQTLLQVAAHAANGYVVVVSGHEGVGKSRLVEEITGLADQHGTLWSVVGAVPRARRGFSHPAALLAAHGARSRTDESSLTAPVTDLLTGRYESTAETGIHGRVAQDRLVTAALAWLVDRVSEGPVVIVLDNLQEADDLTLALGGRLVRMAGTIGASVVLCVRDPSAVPVWLPDNPLHVPLGPLSTEDVATMMGHALGAGADAGLVARAAGAARGMPSVVQSLVPHLLSGDLGAVDQAAALGATDAVRALARARIDALAEPARQLLWAASVLGYDTSERELFRTYQGSGGQVEALAELEGAGLVTRDFGGRVRFANPTLWRTTSSTVPSDQRRAIHASAAQVIASSDMADTRAMEVGEHQFEAGEHAIALATLAEAAEVAEQEGELREAIWCLRLAVEAGQQLGASGLSGQLEAYRELGRLLLDAGDLKGAEEALATGLDKTRVLQSAALEADFQRLQGRLAVTQGDVQGGRAMIDAALRGATAARELLAAARACADLADTDERLGDPGAAGATLRLGLSFLQSAEEGEPLRERLRLLKRLGRVEQQARNYAVAAALLTEAVDVADRAHDRYEKAGLLGNLGSVYARQNDMARAIELTDRARRESADLGDLVGVSRQTYNMALIHFRAGQLEPAQDLLQQSRAVALRAGWRRGVAMADAALGKIGAPPAS